MEVFGGDMQGFQDDIDTIKRYDDFFQLWCMPNHFASPAHSDIPLNAVVHICNFKGWSARQLMDPVLIRDYADKYHLSIEIDDRNAYVTIP